MKLENNALYIHRINGYCFWYYNGEFVTMNEHTGSVEVYEESEMEASFPYLQKVEDNLRELNLEEYESDTDEPQQEE